MTQHLRIAYLPYSHLPFLLRAPLDHDILSVSVRSGLPEGTRLLAIHNCPERAAFGCILEHESFLTVLDGQPIPEHDSLLTMEGRSYRVVKEHVIPQFYNLDVLCNLKDAIEKRIAELQ